MKTEYWFFFYFLPEVSWVMTDLTAEITRTADFHFSLFLWALLVRSSILKYIFRDNKAFSIDFKQ